MKTPNELPFCLALLCLVSKGFTPASLCNGYMTESGYLQCAPAVVAWWFSCRAFLFSPSRGTQRQCVECSANGLSLSSRWKMTSTCWTPQLLWVCARPLCILRSEAFSYVNSSYFFPFPNNSVTNPAIQSSMHFLVITDCLQFEVNLFSQSPRFHCWCVLLLWLKRSQNSSLQRLTSQGRGEHV